MGLQKLVPTCGLAAERSRIQSIALADVVDGRIAHLESQIGQPAHDALAAPGWVFLEQCNNEFSSPASTDGRPTGLVLAKVHFLATRTRNQRSRVSGVTRVANFPRRRRPTRLAFRASRIRWASVKRLGLPPSCSRRMRFSS